MAIKRQCPGCRQQIRVPEDTIGRPVRCPHCQYQFTLATDDGPGTVGVRPRFRYRLSSPREAADPGTVAIGSESASGDAGPAPASGSPAGVPKPATVPASADVPQCIGRFHVRAGQGLAGVL